ncbi:MarR family winged helix-turn-helix transcriptional regulator [Actinopolymorpha rutila]|uniref:DNA-binding MarR family transcriptional regulator n=1 Tax=Actinopolymorpha rutila TaxID=446787 RepID=A0A852ZCZ8_9ACTN|nr:MarR family transcriptional regulator [Actinopolymorpha rutila]NYH91017.1 DNA-binding MarR family transcriptional regulator [Actinopolymorpha rutila]
MATADRLATVHAPDSPPADSPAHPNDDPKDEPRNDGGDDTAEQIAALLDGLVRRQRRAGRGSLEALGVEVTQGQMRVLRTLGHAGDPLRISELANQLGIVPRSATSVVDDLEEAGLVARKPDPDDRRATLVGLTSAGGQVLARIRRSRRDAMVAMVERLDAGERADLLRLLGRLAEGDGCSGRPDHGSP